MILLNFYCVLGFGLSYMGDIQELSISSPKIVQRTDFIGYRYRVKNIKIKKDVKRIESYAFQGFTKPETIYISEFLEYFSSSATLNCENLQSITVSQNNPNFYNDSDMNLYSKNTTVLIRVMPKKTTSAKMQIFTIPSTVTTIEQFAFANTDMFGVNFERTSNISTLGILSFSLSGLYTITIPSTVTSIQNQSFYKCQKLQSVIFGENTNTQKYIGYESFSYTSISEFLFPYNCIVDNDVFSHCQSLTFIGILDSSTSISINTFSGCLSIESISLNSKKYVIENSFLYSNDFTELYYIIQQHSGIDYYRRLPNINNMCETAFLNHSINTLTRVDSIPTNGKYSIVNGIVYDTRNNYAISSLNGISRVTIKQGTVKICKRCFFNQNIQSFQILDHNSLTMIESEAFYGCKINSSLYFNGQVMIIEKYTFQNSEINLIIISASEKLVLMESAFERANISNYISINHNLSYIGKCCFYNSTITNIYSYNVQNISEIEDETFANCTISSIILPTSIEKIGISAFENCRILQYITQSQTRQDTTSKSSIYYAYISLNYIRKFEAFSFNNCTLIYSIFIGYVNEVEFIGPGAFSNISSLITVSIGNTSDNVLNNETFYEINLSQYFISPNNKYYSSYYASNYACIYNKNFSILLWSVPSIPILYLKRETIIIADYAFYFRRSLSSISFTQENSLEIIGNYAFSFTSITSLDYLHNLKSIGDYAFNSSGLMHVTLPTNLKYIGNMSFAYISVSNISIPENCEFIGDEAFSHNNYLINATFEHNLIILNLSKGLFSSCKKLENVSLPKDLIFIGDETFKECQQLKIIYIPSTCKAIGQGTFESSGIQELVFAENSNLELIDRKGFYRCTILNTINIPAKCKYLEFQSFYGCSIPSIIFDKGSELLTIGDQSFFQSNLRSIAIRSSCNMVGSRAFSAFTLYSIEFEQNSRVQSIENFTFSNSIIEKIKIPSSCK